MIFHWNVNVPVHNSVEVIPIIEEFQIEGHGRFGRPQPHGINAIIVIARNGIIIGNRQNGLRVHPVASVFSRSVLDTTSVESDLDTIFWSGFLPRIAIPQPIVRLLNLILQIVNFNFAQNPEIQNFGDL